nr:MAG TPA: hypothetical protein [Caudoviricetes sp.]
MNKSFQKTLDIIVRIVYIICTDAKGRCNNVSGQRPPTHRQP